MTVNPETEITVTCGAAEAMASALLGIVDPGDEVIVFEPFYENYGPDAILCGAKPVYVPLAAAQELDLDRLASAFSARTRAIIVCTPNNPTGRVLSRRELEAIAQLCRRHDAYAVTDEIYEHIYYEGEHIPIATLDGMRERTITISGASKTFSVTGWRIGTIVAPPDATDAIRKVHDFLTVGAPAPLQEAVAVGLETLGDDYYERLAHEYRARRDLLCRELVDAGSRCTIAAAARPSGRYDARCAPARRRRRGGPPRRRRQTPREPPPHPLAPGSAPAPRRCRPRSRRTRSTAVARHARAATARLRRETPAPRAGGTAPRGAHRRGPRARIPPCAAAAPARP